VQHHPENLMQDRDGKRLMSEALYLWGVMLFLTEVLVPGIVRERILISYYRYKGHSVISSIDYIC